MLEMELNCDSSGISPMVKVRYVLKNFPECRTKLDWGQPGHSRRGTAGSYRSAHILPNGHMPWGEWYTDHSALLPLQ